MREADIDDLDFTPPEEDTVSGSAPAAPASSAIRIVKGSPSDAELAALVTVLAAASAGSDAVPGSGLPEDRWGEPVRMHRTFQPASPYSFRPAR